VFEEALRLAPDHPSGHIGLANACAMQFETTRADAVPERAALELAIQHAREACRLDAQSAEAWATLGFILDRAGNRTDGAVAARRAVSLEPGNWRHHFRLAFVCWGEERLSAAHRTLALLPGFAFAHWLAATVYVARQAYDEAERELHAGLSAQAPQSAGDRFSSVALHWLLGLLYLDRGDETSALEEFERELAAEASGHLYARECAANTWYAIGALRLRQGHASHAAAAFTRALERVPAHPLARVGLGAVAPARTAHPHGAGGDAPTEMLPRGYDGMLAVAAGLVLASNHEEAARLLDEALDAAPPGNTGWLLPIEPLLQVRARPTVWSSVLSRLRIRAA
jgi:tetratricopeptide (TPR) repeat protein